ncbi:DNA ligase [Gallaecimonas mangrovi]|uniref:DNA ligase n=1 Tax=Gallaecimonas mangrovi TaxID=2291597 RepID=UPI000E202526|nr:DNA ligase [Gallaecimonas mangrovi]
MKAFLSLLLMLVFGNASAEQPLLANHYHGGIDVSQYWVSEKLDGVRGRWNGQQLLTKTGNPIAAPKWFTEPLPKTPLDGELWIGRGQFSQVAAIVLDSHPNDAAWRRVHYMLFDMPQASGDFSARLKTMQALVLKLKLPWVEVIPQQRLANDKALQQQLDKVTQAGGEGLMLHRADALYYHGRSNDLLKLKKTDDMEGTVLAIEPGKGKYQGMMGSLLIELDNGIRFKLGGGFSDHDRAHPPKVGDRVTFSFNGYTKNGKPRFARFLRVRPNGA